MSEEPNEALSRRGFLAISAATLGGVMLAPGIRLIEIAGARAPEQAASKQVRWGLLIDTNKCATGCDDCVKACATENGIKDTGHPRTDPQWIRKLEVNERRSGRTALVPWLWQ